MSEALAIILLRQGYFWPIMRTEVKNLVKRCKKCQEHAHIQRLPSELVTLADYSIPFILCGIDLIGTLPIAPGGLKYCVVAVNYLTKWVDAEPLAIGHNLVEERSEIRLEKYNIQVQVPVSHSSGQWYPIYRYKFLGPGIKV